TRRGRATARAGSPPQASSKLPAWCSNQPPAYPLRVELEEMVHVAPSPILPNRVAIGPTIDAPGGRIAPVCASVTRFNERADASEAEAGWSRTAAAVVPLEHGGQHDDVADERDEYAERQHLSERRQTAVRREGEAAEAEHRGQRGEEDSPGGARCQHVDLVG